MAEVLLSAQKVTKRFGGLAAVNGVSVDPVSYTHLEPTRPY